jgi:hypothetical protein
MFRACHDSHVVRTNLQAVRAALQQQQEAPSALADEVKRLAEDMAAAACATDPGEFVAKERARLHAAIDRLAAAQQPPKETTDGC